MSACLRGVGAFPLGMECCAQGRSSPSHPRDPREPERFIRPTLKTEEEFIVKRPDRAFSGLISAFSLPVDLLRALFYLGCVPGAAHLSPSSARRQLGVPAPVPVCTGSVDGFNICKKETPSARHASGVLSAPVGRHIPSSRRHFA